MCSKLFATFVPFSVLSLIRPRTIKVASTSHLSFALFTWQKIPGSPRLHNFNVRVPKRGSLGTRRTVTFPSKASAHCTTYWHHLLTRGLKVAYWLKHWTVDQKVQGSSPTCSRDLFLFWVHSALPQKLNRRFTFMSFGGDIKVPGNPLKLA